jgi:hypothetical protein
MKVPFSNSVSNKQLNRFALMEYFNKIVIGINCQKGVKLKYLPNISPHDEDFANFGSPKKNNFELLEGLWNHSQIGRADDSIAISKIRGIGVR